jgi:aspartyl-tRNA(Asn)/glutamyl-tRNA(Gln) amidotransferase subunit B
MVDPIATGGKIRLSELDGLKYPRVVNITQLQLEQDTAKSLSNDGIVMASVDYNRSNAGLVEIVMDPDLRSSKEAGLIVRKLQLLLRCLRVSEANMDNGSMRVDVNVSVCSDDGSQCSARCELKNLIGAGNIEDAIGMKHIVIIAYAFRFGGSETYRNVGTRSRN